MGYRYSFESVIHVPAEKVPDMMEALMPVAKAAMSDSKRAELENLPTRVLSRGEILDQLRYGYIFSEQDDLILLYHSESKSNDKEEPEAIAPFVDDGSYVQIQGEDQDDLSRFVFRDGKIKIVQAVISFPED